MKYLILFIALLAVAVSAQQRHAVEVDQSANLLAPTNFFNQNSAIISNALNGYFVTATNGLETLTLSGRFQTIWDNGNQAFLITRNNTIGSQAIQLGVRDGNLIFNYGKNSSSFVDFLYLSRDGNGAFGNDQNAGTIYDQSNNVVIATTQLPSGLDVAEILGVVQQLGGQSNYFSGDISSPHFWGDGSHLTGTGATQITPSTGYSNRLAFTITSRNTADATNQRVQVTFVTNATAPMYLNLGICRSDGNDIIPFDSDGITKLTNFWLKSINLSNAVMDIVLPSLLHDTPPQGKTIFIDYGNAGASVTGGWTNVLTTYPVQTNSTMMSYSFNEGARTNVYDYGTDYTNGTLVVTNPSTSGPGGVWMTGNGPGPSGVNVPGFESSWLLLTNGSFAYSTNTSAWCQNMNVQFTVSCWVYLTNPPTGGNIAWIWMKSQNGGQNYNAVLARNGVFNFWYNGAAGIVALAGTTTVPTNTWCHLVAIAGPYGAKLYVNGKLDGINTAYLQQSPTALSTAGPFIINGDGRGGVSANSPSTAIGYGPMTVQLREWTEDDVRQTFNFLGAPVATLEKDKWVHAGPMPSNPQYVAANMGEVSRFRASYDGLWKQMAVKADASGIAGLQGPTRDGAYLPFSITTSGTVFQHAWFQDDNAGKMTAYWINPSSYNIGYATSVNGGSNFTVSGSAISTASQILNASAPGSGGQGNVSVSRITGGPFGGQWLILEELKQTAGTYFLLWGFLGTNNVGNFSALNGGNPLSTMQIYSGGSANDPSQVIWSNGKYHTYVLEGPGVTPVCVFHVSSFDLVNWFVEGSAIELNDIAYTFDNIGNQRVFSDYGGTCSMIYIMFNNYFGNSSFPQFSATNGYIGTIFYNGTRDQLWTPGTVGINGQSLFGDVGNPIGLLESPGLPSPIYAGQLQMPTNYVPTSWVPIVGKAFFVMSNNACYSVSTTKTNLIFGP